MLVVFCGNINKWGKKPHFSRSNGFSIAFVNNVPPTK